MDELKSFSKRDLEIIKNHFYKIYSHCENTFEIGTGSYLFDGIKYELSENFYDKQLLLFNKVAGKKNVLEIGTYMGHSILIMLVANPKLNITTIDVNDKFARPATEYLKSQFPDSNIKFIHNESLKAIAEVKEKFDFFHIDGDHKNKTVTKEFNKCKKICLTNQLEIIFDDNLVCQNLIENIETTYRITEKISKGINWNTNLYLSIDYPKKKFERFTTEIIFGIKNIFKYVNLKIGKLFKFKKI